MFTMVCLKILEVARQVISIQTFGLRSIVTPGKDAGSRSIDARPIFLFKPAHGWKRRG